MAIIATVLLIIGCLQSSSSFRIIWNAPSFQCKVHGILFEEVRAVGIEQNADDEFNGDHMTLFYETSRQLGLYPYISKRGQDINGGLPLRSDLNAHLEEAARDAESFLGGQRHRAKHTPLAVIDWETWWPVWNHNSRRVKLRATQMVLEDEGHPPTTSWSDPVPPTLRHIIKQRFEDKAREFLWETMRLLNEPPGYNRLVGFYAIPRCPLNLSELPQGRCNIVGQTLNNRQEWLIHQVGALYPSAYLRHAWHWRRNKDYLTVQVRETQRLLRRSQLTHKPVFLYVSFAYRESLVNETTNSLFLSEKDLETILQYSSELGVDGVVLWGASILFSSRGRCERAHHYVTQHLLPAVERLNL